jgi:hypothetical protein
VVKNFFLVERSLKDPVVDLLDLLEPKQVAE